MRIGNKLSWAFHITIKPLIYAVGLNPPPNFMCRHFFLILLLCPALFSAETSGHYAARANSLSEFVSHMAGIGTDDLNTHNDEGESPLRIIATRFLLGPDLRAELIPRFIQMLDAGGDANIEDGAVPILRRIINIWGTAPASPEISVSFRAILEALIHHGVQWMDPENALGSPLFALFQFAYPWMIEVAMEFEIDINQQDNDGMNIAHLLILARQDEMDDTEEEGEAIDYRDLGDELNARLEYFAGVGGNLNHRNYADMTPFQLTLRTDDFHAANILLDFDVSFGVEEFIYAIQAWTNLHGDDPRREELWRLIMRMLRFLCHGGCKPDEHDFMPPDSPEKFPTIAIEPVDLKSDWGSRFEPEFLSHW